MAHNWKGVGEALRLNPALLKTIQADHPDVRSRLDEVLTEWLNKAYDTTRFGLPSWKLLVAAVAHPAGGNDRALAERIAGKYNGKCILLHECMDRMSGYWYQNTAHLCDTRLHSPSIIYLHLQGSQSALPSYCIIT